MTDVQEKEQQVTVEEQVPEQGKLGNAALWDISIDSVCNMIVVEETYQLTVKLPGGGEDIKIIVSCFVTNQGGERGREHRLTFAWIPCRLVPVKISKTSSSLLWNLLILAPTLAFI